MDNAKFLKIIAAILAILGLATAGVCIWILADPLKFLNPGYSPKIAIAAAVLMSLVGIATVILPVNTSERIFLSSGLTFVALGLSLTSLSIAISEISGNYPSIDIIKSYYRRMKIVAGFSGCDAAIIILALCGFFVNRA
ncbi:uncharacterized protein LOC111641008 isoform X2 [Centruroides sculpturatus]|uniref:uncharacterized protein LOC111641008 isoform X2 n=1 Tax=Centruroides sculpturatus TaxID=218467 RepID=UPI000C6DFEFA|nr:uncharacterized protein LOC111641008 isoform X2 [Centruroides sculpturatus]